MTAAAFADRLTLYDRLHAFPSATIAEHAAAIGRCRRWVAKWKARIGSPPHPDPLVACRSRSSARHHPPPSPTPHVVARILHFRDTLPDQFHRTVGPKTIAYYLQHDPERTDDPLPRSTTTIWKILHQHQRIHTPPRRQRQPLQPPAPWTELELDFTDIPSIIPDPDGKRQHAGEVFNWIDVGTARPLAMIADGAFSMERAIRVSAAVVLRHGIPPLVRYDRDPRFVGAQQMDDFPSPWERLWLCLGTTLDCCPPGRPDLKPSVERFHATLKTECLRPAWPTIIPDAQAAIDAWEPWYCDERPHQGRACQNQPPAVVYPDPPAWPQVPATLDPNRWVAQLHGKTWVRRVSTRGSITIGGNDYYVSRTLAGQDVVVRMDAPTQELVIYHAEHEYRRRRLRNLITTDLPFEQFIDQLCAAARGEDARIRDRQRRRR